MAEKEKLKVVRVIARLNIGGPAIHSIILTKMLDSDRFESFLVAGTPEKSEGDMTYLAKELGVRPEVINELGRSISWKDDLIAFVKLYRILRRIRPHIVHTHTAKAGTLGRLAAMLAGVPVRIHTFHGHIFHSYFGRRKTKIFLAIERVLAYFTDKIVTLSPNQKRELSEEFKLAPKEKFAVIPLGLDLEPFFKSDTKRGILRKEFGIADNCLLVGTVGRLVGVKNHRMFLDAAARISKRNPGCKVKYLIVGDGELKDELMSYSRAIGLENDVIFTGWRKDLVALYADLDIIALTSTNEGTPVCLIEAMAAGKPVIGTCVGGVRDLIKDGYNGLVVENGEVGELANRILELVNDEDRRRTLGVRGQEFVRGAFSKERLLKDIESLYKDVILKRSKKYI